MPSWMSWLRSFDGSSGANFITFSASGDRSGQRSRYFLYITLVLLLSYRDGGSSAKDLSECVELLLQLDEPAEELCDKFLNHARARLELDLQGLEAEIKPYSSARVTSPADNSPKATTVPSPTSNTDILEFIDRGCNEFVSSLCLVITSYQDLFINHAQTRELASKNIPQMATSKLHAFVDELAARYFSLVEHRIQEEKGVGDNSLLVRALDRFHRRLQAVAKLLPGSDVPNKGTEIVIRAATERVKQYLSALQSFYLDSLTDVRQALATPRLSVSGASAAGGGAASSRDAPTGLPDLLSSLSASILNQIKSVLASVHLFTAKDITFSNKPYFKVDSFPVYSSLVSPQTFCFCTLIVTALSDRLLLQG